MRIEGLNPPDGVGSDSGIPTLVKLENRAAWTRSSRTPPNCFALM